MNVKFVTKEASTRETPGCFNDDGYLYLKIKGLSNGELKRISTVVKNVLSNED